MAIGYLFGVIGLSLVMGPHIIRKIKLNNLRQASSTSFTSNRAKQYMGPFGSPMNMREATLILGVRETATKDKILSAHKKLMLLNHPDNGGSTYIALKVNEAKEYMIERMST